MRENSTKLYAIWDWRDGDVYAYLKARKIPLPPKFGVVGRTSTGLSLETDTLVWLRDQHPADYAVLLRSFPYIPAMLTTPEAVDG